MNRMNATDPSDETSSDAAHKPQSDSDGEDKTGWTRLNGHSVEKVREMCDGEVQQQEVAGRLGVAQPTLSNFMRLHDIETDGGKMDPQDYLDDIIRVYGEVGEWPTMTQYRKHGNHSAQPAYQYFGGFPEARDAAKERWMKDD